MLLTLESPMGDGEAAVGALNQVTVRPHQGLGLPWRGPPMSVTGQTGQTLTWREGPEWP